MDDATTIIGDYMLEYRVDLDELIDRCVAGIFTEPFRTPFEPKRMCE